MFCHICGNELNDKIRFCPKCGTERLIQEKDVSPELKIQSKTELLKVCPHCKAKIPKIAIKCRNCGNEVRTTNERLLIRDFWGPLWGLLTVVAFFLPWIIFKNRWTDDIVKNGTYLFGESINHPIIIPFIVFALILVSIIIYISNFSSSGDFPEYSYRIRAACTFISGIVWFIYSVLIYSTIDNSEVVGFGLLLTSFSTLCMIISGLYTFFGLYPVYRQGILKNGFCFKCNIQNAPNATFCRKCGQSLKKDENIQITNTCSD